VREAVTGLVVLSGKQARGGENGCKSPIQFVRPVFDLSPEGKHDTALGQAGIAACEALLRDTGCHTRLPDVGVGDSLVEQAVGDASLVVGDEQSVGPQ